MNTPMLLRMGVANDMSSLRPTLQNCIETVLSVSDSMVDDLLDGLTAAVASTGALQVAQAHGSLDPALVRRLLNDADAIKHTWQTQLRHALYHGGRIDTVSTSQVRFDDLRLLDEQQIDASIGFALAEQELTRASAELLPRLNALVSSLMGWLTVQADINPLKPAAFACALRDLLTHHVPDVAQRNALLAPAAGAMGESLRQVYRQLIQWLMVHGVEPLDVQVLGPKGTVVPHSPLGRTLLTLGRLRRLLAGDLDAGPVMGQEFVQTVPMSMTALEDMELLEPLIARLRHRASRSAAQPLAAELPVVEGLNLGRLLGQEVVRLMLDNLTQDERLLPAIRQQIGLMEPVLIALSHADPRFFSERQHPARQLLEVVTQRSLGYLSQNDEGFADLLRSVVAAVEAIRRAPAIEESFARLLLRLRRYWDEDDARKSQMRTEAARALLHAEQRHLLAERLAVDFRHRIADKELPGFVVNFLCRPWAQAVAQAQLAGVLDAADGSPITSVADDLIWCVQIQLIQRDRSRLAKLMPRLLGQLRQALLRIEYPHDRTGAFFDALVALQEQAFEPPVAPAESLPFPFGKLPPQDVPILVDRLTVPEADATDRIGPVNEALPDPKSTQTEPAVQPSSPNDRFWMADSEVQHAGYVAVDSGPMPLDPLELPSTELLPGAWVDLLIEGEWARAQLTWASPHGTLFMFVSAKGLAHSMTRRTLERLRSSDVLRVVSRGDVVEGALDAVAAEALRNAAASDSGA
ncbi:MAG: hypothetical protein ACI9M6_001274 [Hydrogenophaga sp.]|jgi:hypothetical protein